MSTEGIARRVKKSTINILSRKTVEKGHAYNGVQTQAGGKTFAGDASTAPDPADNDGQHRKRDPPHNEASNEETSMNAPSPHRLSRAPTRRMASSKDPGHRDSRTGSEIGKEHSHSSRGSKKEAEKPSLEPARNSFKSFTSTSQKPLVTGSSPVVFEQNQFDSITDVIDLGSSQHEPVLRPGQISDFTEGQVISTIDNSDSNNRTTNRVLIVLRARAESQAMKCIGLVKVQSGPREEMFYDQHVQVYQRDTVKPPNPPFRVWPTIKIDLVEKFTLQQGLWWIDCERTFDIPWDIEYARLGQVLADKYLQTLENAVKHNSGRAQ